MSQLDPAKNLQSVKVANSLRRNIPLVSSKTKVLSCRALWHSSATDNPLLSIADKRCGLDKSLQTMAGIEFFISCITGTKTNSVKKAEPVVRPGIAYFIVFKNTKDLNEETIFKSFHDSGFLPTMTTIKNNQANPVESILQLLKQVVKDSNSSFGQEALKASLEYLEEQEEFDDRMPCIKNCNITACRLVVVNKSLDGSVRSAYEKLVEDGMVIHLSAPNPETSKVSVNIEPTTNIGKACDLVNGVMMLRNHVLYRGAVYRKAPKGEYAFEYMSSVDTYLQSLLAIRDIQDDLINNMGNLSAILSNKDCYLILQIKFNYDLIEVLNGKCFKLSSRDFVKTPLTPTRYRRISPRCFHDYDLERDGYDAGVFASSIRNYFPGDAQRICFINKLYQCLLYKQLPQKTTKLVTVGKTNSGKTSWAKLFFGLLGERHIATVAREKSFALAMIDEHTQILLIDEWNEKTLTSNQCKEYFQGGWIALSKKFKNATGYFNELGVYITCNKEPEFGEDQENVMNRLAVYPTVALPNRDKYAPDWIRDNAMICLVWMAKEINRLKVLIPETELFYERASGDNLQIIDNDPLPTNEINEMLSLSHHDIAKAMPTFVPFQKEVGVVVDNQRAGPSKVQDQKTKAVEKEEEEYLTLSVMQKLKRIDCLNIPTILCNSVESDVDDMDNFLPKRLRYSDINTSPYHREVKRLLKNELDIGRDELVKQTHWKMFLLKMAAKKGKDYKLPDPLYDAWMCVRGDYRDVFDGKSFVIRYPSVKLHLTEIRELCNITLPSKNVEDFSDREHVAAGDWNSSLTFSNATTVRYLSPTYSNATTVNYVSSPSPSLMPPKKRAKKIVFEPIDEDIDFKIDVGSTSVEEMSHRREPEYILPPTRVRLTFPNEMKFGIDKNNSKLPWIQKIRMNPSMRIWNAEPKEIYERVPKAL